MSTGIRVWGTACKIGVQNSGKEPGWGGCCCLEQSSMQGWSGGAAAQRCPRQQNNNCVVLQGVLLQFSLKAAGVFPLTSVNFGSDHIKLFGRFTPKGVVLSLKEAKFSLAFCLESLESWNFPNETDMRELSHFPLLPPSSFYFITNVFVSVKTWCI